jgi:hypothetical protein
MKREELAGQMFVAHQRTMDEQRCSHDPSFSIRKRDLVNQVPSVRAQWYAAADVALALLAKETGAAYREGFVDSHDGVKSVDKGWRETAAHAKWVRDADKDEG